VKRTLGVAVALVVLAACGSADDAAGTVPAVTTSEPGPTAPEPTGGPTVPAASGGTEPSGPASDPPRLNDEQQAIADLARRQGVDPSAITTVSVENVTWRDSSIGCPQQGMQYLQVLVDGVRVVLELDGRRYEYHSGRGRPPFYCATPQPPVGE
jgi:hypothetical protein